MSGNERYSSFPNEELEHLSDVEMSKLRNVIKTKMAGELSIKNSNLERTLYLAGQNMMKKTVERIQSLLEEIYHTDEYFLDEIESILAPFWEELTDDEIARLMIESFEIFDIDKQGFLEKQVVIENLTKFGEMPLNKKDFQIMFSMIDDSKQFDYQQFVTKLCGSNSPKRKKKKKKKKKKKVKRTIK